MRKFKELEVWQIGREISIEAYSLTKRIPKEELYGLTSQIRRSSISISSNIAEGCSRSSNKELIRFLEISIGSAFELETQLIISTDIGFFQEDEIEDLIGKINSLQMKLNAFIKSIKKF